ncbi:GTPase HflX [candidate division WOR-3 bacterium]|nr:GTPase HflX [candidate division WOR-3 bacterium]
MTYFGKKGQKMKFFISVAVSGKRDKERNLVLLHEMDGLLRTLGYESTENFFQTREKPDSKFYAGKGKIDEIKDCAEKTEAAYVVFVNELSGSQIKSVEKATGLSVYTRKDIILEIFSRHARSKIAMAEVEMAQLKHRLSRIVGGFDYMSRQAGGIGTKGPGETKLETEKRAIKRKISMIENFIEKNSISLKMQKERRRDKFRVSLVGYTNSGKTTLLNALTGSSSKTSSQMFSTIDTTTRQMKHSDWTEKILVSDTVGFVEELPFELIESFKSTLEEVSEADLRLLVADFSEENYSSKIKSVEKVLENLGCVEGEKIILLNKKDAAPTEVYPQDENLLIVSGKTGEGIEDLKREILKRAKRKIESADMFGKPR